MSCAIAIFTSPQPKPFQVSNKNFTERAFLFKNVNTRRILSKKTTKPKETTIKNLESKKLQLKRRYENVTTSGNKKNAHTTESAATGQESKISAANLSKLHNNITYKDPNTTHIGLSSLF